MREDLVVPGEGEENFVLARDARVVTIPFTPLEVRMQKEKPEVFARLQKLKEIIGEDTFKRLVSRVHNINYADTRIMLVAESELHRTNIERTIMQTIVNDFEVNSIHLANKQ